jgi:predicted nucleotidyltransferase
VATKQYPIPIPYDAIAEFCQRNHIRKLSLVGSVLRDDFTPESDVDVLVEFEPGKTPGWQIVSVEKELASVLGRPVDLRTGAELSEYFRDEVLSEAESIYVAA